MKTLHTTEDILHRAKEFEKVETIISGELQTLEDLAFAVRTLRRATKGAGEVADEDRLNLTAMAALRDKVLEKLKAIGQFVDVNFDDDAEARQEYKKLETEVTTALGILYCEAWSLADTVITIANNTLTTARLISKANHVSRLLIEDAITQLRNIVNDETEEDI